MFMKTAFIFRFIATGCSFEDLQYDRDGFSFEDTVTIHGLEDIPTIPNETELLSGQTIREKYSNYFSSSEGSVSWQLDCI